MKLGSKATFRLLTLFLLILGCAYDAVPTNHALAAQETVKNTSSNVPVY
jgi:hypothetical protein